MFSFRSFLFAAAAFATVASAIPMPDTSTGATNILGGLTSGKILPAGLPSAPHKRRQMGAEADVDARDILPADMASAPLRRRQKANVAAEADVDARDNLSADMASAPLRRRQKANVAAEADVDARDILSADMASAPLKRRQNDEANVAAQADIDARDILPADMSSAPLRRRQKTLFEASDVDVGVRDILPADMASTPLMQRQNDEANVAAQADVDARDILPADMASALLKRRVEASVEAVVDAREVRRGQLSCGEIVKKCHDDIAVVVVKIEAAVKVRGDAKYVDHGLVISLLWEVVALLEGLLHDLKLIVKAEIILGVTLKELAGLVADLLIVVIEVVWLVLSIVGFLDFTLCGVIATIGGLLYEILEVVFGLVDGLLILVVGLIEPYGAHCKYIRYTDILILLGIKI